MPSRPANHRQGSVLVLTLVFMAIMLGVVAFVIDIGYLLVARTELQRSADAGAIAAAWEMIDEDALFGDFTMTEPIARARAKAVEFAGANSVCTASPAVDPNEDNDESGDVVLGTISSFSGPDAPMAYDTPALYNAVKVRVQRTAQRNGQVPFFFAGVFGHSGIDVNAQATAGFMKQVGGIQTPGDGSSFPFLPIALDLDTWNDLQDGLIPGDDWAWDGEAGSVVYGPDGISEVNLYPQGNLSPGNRGTVNVGGSNNSTSRVSRQITDGLTPEDLDYHGGELSFDENGEMLLGADPGISAGFQQELASIIGKPVMIPIFREMSGNGDNGVYTIVKFVGIRIVDVELSGNDKRVIIQPAIVITTGLIPAAEGSGETSQYIYSPPYLIR